MIEPGKDGIYRPKAVAYNASAEPILVTLLRNECRAYPEDQDVPTLWDWATNSRTDRCAPTAGATPSRADRYFPYGFPPMTDR